MNRRSQSSRTPDAPAANRQRGSIVVYLALSLVVFGVMAIAGGSRFGASVLGVSAPNCATQARLMAESGVRYAMSRLRSATTQAELTTMISTLNGQTYTVDAAKGLKFTLTVTATSTGKAQVQAAGSACGGASFLPTSSTQAAAVVNVPAVTPADFSNVADDFARTTDLQGNSPISVDPVTGSISFGILGQTENAAAIWYRGNATAGCVDGNCTMTYGLRSYFEVQWVPGSAADGLVFGILSAETNKVNAVGGETWMGELMAWGGRGTLGSGIRAPKFGLEFDTYYNGCAGSPIAAGSRCDDSNGWDHLAYIFWGSQADFSSGGTNYGPSFDDNRHGAGAGNASEPISPVNPDGLGSGRFGYYYGATNNWIKGTSSATTKYAIRHELSRIGTKNSEGNYPYILKSWVRNAPGASPYNDVSVNYTAAAPDMQRVIHLTPALHAQMAKVLFGWSEATGASTQKLTVSKFALDFKKAADVLTIPGDYVSYWNMNAVSGTNVPNAIVAIPGTIVPAAINVPVVTPASPASYPYGQALSFAGDAGRVRVNDANNLDLQAQGSIAVWIYPTALTNDTYILHKGNQADTSDESYSLRFSTGGKVELMIRWGNQANRTVLLESSALPAINRWYHVVAQWDNDILAIYINGMLNSIATNANNRAAQNTAGNLIIGARHTAGGGPYKGFNGYIDEVYLYNRVLTASEIAAMSLMP
jgi:hypothetical protein